MTNLLSFLLAIYATLMVLLFAVVFLFLKMRKLERKLVDFNPGEMTSFLDKLRDMTQESERVATQLDISIKEREAALEDLIDLVDTRIRRLEGITDTPAPKTSITEMIQDILPPEDFEPVTEEKKKMSRREKAIAMAEAGYSDADIAEKMGISMTEVNIIRSIVKHRQ